MSKKRAYEEVKEKKNQKAMVRTIRVIYRPTSGQVVRGVKKRCGRKKFVTLADDLALVAKIEEEKKVMLKRFKVYVEKKMLKLNEDKYKVMVLKKGGIERKYRWEMIG